MARISSPCQLKRTVRRITRLNVVGHHSAEELVDLIRLEVFRPRAIASDRTEQGEEPEDPASAGEIGQTRSHEPGGDRNDRALLIATPRRR